MDREEIIKIYEGNHFAAFCGMQLIEQPDGSFEIRGDIREEHTNPYGYIHGGYLFAMADSVTGSNARRFIARPVTLNSDFHYLSNQIGGSVRSTATVVKAGRKIVVLHCEIRSENEDNKLLAEGDFTYYNAE